MQVVTLCSGGLDSVVLAHFIAACGFTQVLLTFDYGQKGREELVCADYCADQLHTTQLRMPLVFPANPLTDTTQSVDGDDPRHWYVPNRNIVFLAHGYSVAASYGAKRVAIASEGGSDVGEIFLSPDDTEETLASYAAMQMLANKGMHTITLWRPFTILQKANVVLLGRVLGVDFTHTWSCYAQKPQHCGVCKGCLGRKIAFRDAGVPDHTEYCNV